MISEDKMLRVTFVLGTRSLWTADQVISVQESVWWPGSVWMGSWSLTRQKLC